LPRTECWRDLENYDHGGSKPPPYKNAKQKECIERMHSFFIVTVRW
jgi:hypothetical protein